MTITAYLRQDGRKGIRNAVIVAYMVECARHVAQEIVLRFRGQPVQMIGFPGCYPNDYAARMMRALCTHPNVGAVLLVSLGCEGMNRDALLQLVRESGRPAELVVIQETGGTRRSIAAGRSLGGEHAGAARDHAARADDGAASSSSAPSAAARTRPAASPPTRRSASPSTRWSPPAARAIFEETGELIGLEQVMAERAATPALARRDPRLHAQDRGVLPRARPEQLRARQRRWRADHDRGEIARRLCQERQLAHRRPDQARRRAAARRALSARRGAGRRRSGSAFPTSTTMPRSPN